MDTVFYKVGHRVFQVGLVLKGINAFFELVFGSLLLVVPFETIRDWTAVAVGWGVSVLPEGWSGHLAGALEHLHQGMVVFVAWYFLSHGIVKAFVIGCLFKGKKWAYPLGIAVFVAFGVYQTWEIFHGGGAFYWFLNVLDAALIGLTAVEWVHASKADPAVDKPRP